MGLIFRRCKEHAVEEQLLHPTGRPGTTPSRTGAAILVGGFRCTIDVSFRPTGVPAVSGTLTLTDDVGNPTVITMTGSGIAVTPGGPPPAPTTTTPRPPITSPTTTTTSPSPTTTAPTSSSNVARTSDSFWHACTVNSPNPKREHEAEPGMPDKVRNDGRAAIAITLLAASAIAFLIFKLV
jgi:hypothetical protein